MFNREDAAYFTLTYKELNDLLAFCSLARDRESEVRSCLRRKVADAESGASRDAWIVVLVGSLAMVLLLGGSLFAMALAGWLV